MPIIQTRVRIDNRLTHLAVKVAASPAEILMLLDKTFKKPKPSLLLGAAAGSTGTDTASEEDAADAGAAEADEAEDDEEEEEDDDEDSEDEEDAETLGSADTSTASDEEVDIDTTAKDLAFTEEHPDDVKRGLVKKERKKALAADAAARAFHESNEVQLVSGTKRRAEPVVLEDSDDDDKPYLPAAIKQAFKDGLPAPAVKLNEAELAELTKRNRALGAALAGGATSVVLAPSDYALTPPQLFRAFTAEDSVAPPGAPKKARPTEARLEAQSPPLHVRPPARTAAKAGALRQSLQARILAGDVDLFVQTRPPVPVLVKKASPAKVMAALQAQAARARSAAELPPPPAVATLDDRLSPLHLSEDAPPVPAAQPDVEPEPEPEPKTASSSSEDSEGHIKWPPKGYAVMNPEAMEM